MATKTTASKATSTPSTSDNTATAGARPKQSNFAATLDGRNRVVIEGISPEIDGGRYPIKRTIGQPVVAEIDAFVDGHDVLSCVLQYRKEDQDTWTDVTMKLLVNDRWRGEFRVWEIGRYRYTFSAWVDHFKSWRHDLSRRVQREDIAIALQVGATLLEEASERAEGGDALWLKGRAKALVGEQSLEERLQYALSEELSAMVARYPDKRLATRYDKELALVVDDERAGFSTWYEMFPRSCSPIPGQHGTFKDCEAWLPRIAEMGFDVLYFPPIHPIGRVNRKGKNNTLDPKPGDVGSPWAIGAKEGGHKAVLPELGTLEDFRNLVAKAREFGIDVAMDIAFQCAPDHPYVKEHPQWFRWRPDGTVQYAENPPKKYQDIYPFNFETDDWQSLWEELKSIFEFWIEQGVRIFRVDNPHTKPFPMWEWIITEVKKKRPDAIFLAEAFTRPKVMHRLAKLGYSQSYTYFAWRNTKGELTEYMKELTRTIGREYFRPNFWPNTPDILTEYLQFGGRPGFMIRLALAATLTANYGIYGPAYELMEFKPVKHGSEEYLDSEKYEIRQRNLDQPGTLRDFIAQVNHVRRSSPALRQDWNLCFHETDNEQIICYSKWNDKKTDIILVTVNLDPHHLQAGWVNLDLETLGLEPKKSFEVHDLLSDDHYLWNGPRNYVQLDPKQMPAHIFRLHGRTHTEEDFDYFF
ncbi:MAG: alpha-1,4-glucan--maltose-1-phosphate maltosyltransferase [Candidatus Competibacteraceae bacterium]